MCSCSMHNAISEVLWESGANSRWEGKRGGGMYCTKIKKFLWLHSLGNENGAAVALEQLDTPKKIKPRCQEYVPKKETINILTSCLVTCFQKCTSLSRDTSL